MYKAYKSEVEMVWDKETKTFSGGRRTRAYKKGVSIARQLQKEYIQASKEERIRLSKIKTDTKVYPLGHALWVLDGGLEFETPKMIECLVHGYFIGNRCGFSHEKYKQKDILECLKPF